MTMKFKVNFDKMTQQRVTKSLKKIDIFSYKTETKLEFLKKKIL